MTLLRTVTDHLARLGVPCALTGAAALAVHGLSRSTLDVDLLTTATSILSDDVWTPIAQMGPRVDVRQGDSDDPLAGIVRVSATAERPVDVVVARQRWQADAIARAGAARYLDTDIRAVTAADLVLLKLYAGGTQDRSDVRLLLETLPALRGQVDRAIAAMPPDMRGRWTDWRTGPA